MASPKAKRVPLVAGRDVGSTVVIGDSVSELFEYRGYR